MTTPRAYAELAKLYFSDAETNCWMWNEFYKEWQPDYNPSFSPKFIYHVSKEEPTAPPHPMCELYGKTFPAPEMNHPKRNQEYYVPDISSINLASAYSWEGHPTDIARLEYGIVHLSAVAASQHGRALLFASKQATEKAKEK